MVNEKSIFVATPMYGGVCYSSYVAGLLDTAGICINEGYKIYFLAIGNESLITRGRNELVHKFLETDANYLMFIDADIGFTGQDVFRLIGSDKDVICGIYPKKTIDWNAVESAASKGFTNLKDHAASYVLNVVNEESTPTNGIIEIKHGGTGFMLIKRSVFETLAPFVRQYRVSTLSNKDVKPLIKEYFSLGISPDDLLYLSEDFWFCELWRTHGGKVFADINIKLVHTGTYEYRGNFLVSGFNLT